MLGFSRGNPTFAAHKNQQAMSIKKLPVYEENPSVCLKEKNRMSGVEPRVSLRQLAQPETYINGATGEYVVVQREVKSAPPVQDTAKYTKVFHEDMEWMTELKDAGLRLLIYIFRYTTPNKDRIRLRPEEVQKTAGYASNTSYYKGLTDLLQKNVLYRTEDPQVFFINVNLFFNGDRRKLLPSRKK